MPRNGSGVMSKPPNTTAQPNTTILSAMFNSVIDDIIADLNNPRPITAGGTGASSVEGARAGLGVDQKFIISSKNAAYTADASNNSGMIIVTATATIALTSSATLGSGWHSIVAAKGGVATIDPSGSQKINGALTLVLQDGQSAFIYCTGTVGDEFSAIVFNGARRPFSEKNANYTIGLADDGGEVVFTSAATAGIDAVATLGTGFRVRVRATNGDVLIDPNSAEQINGAATLILKTGQTADITGNGTLFRADVHGDTLSGPQLQGYYTGLGLTTNGTDAANDIDIAVGSASADVSPYYLMQLTSALTKRIDAAWAVGNNQGGLDTGSVANSTYYIYEIMRPDTGVVDICFSLSSTAPTTGGNIPAAYTLKRQIGSLVRASATNGAPRSALGPVDWVDIGPVATTSGTSIDITGIPATVNEIEIWFNAVSTSSTAHLSVQLGVSGTPVTTGYKSGAGLAGSGVRISDTSSFIVYMNLAAGEQLGCMRLKRFLGANKWVESHATTNDMASGTGSVGGGNVTLSGGPNMVRITTTTGTPTFDAGEVVVRYK